MRAIDTNVLVRLITRDDAFRLSDGASCPELRTLAPGGVDRGLAKSKRPKDCRNGMRVAAAWFKGTYFDQLEMIL